MSIAAIIAAEFDRPVAPAITGFAARLAARAPATVAAVLFYGAAMRSGDLDGLLDFYVIVDSAKAWHRRRLPALANRLLPPSIEFVDDRESGRPLRAKVAILERGQFESRVGDAGADGTIWARFAQPVALVHCRDAAARAWVIDAVTQAVVTAARWAAWLGPEADTPRGYWRALFTATYGAELRIETAARADAIIDAAPDRYAALLPAAWKAAGIAYAREEDGRLRPAVDRRYARARWAHRRRWGKALNLMRLAKASFTTPGAARYIAWKVERHAGLRIEPTPWQERHPLLAGLALLWKLRRRGLVR